MCRDRQPYLTDVRLGPDKPSVIPAINHVRRNMIIANYAGAAGPVDTDDGSSYLHTESNFLSFGGGIKSQWYGHSMNTTNNILAYPVTVFGSFCIHANWYQGPHVPPEFYIGYWNNTCILPGTLNVILSFDTLSISHPSNYVRQRAVVAAVGAPIPICRAAVSRSIPRSSGSGCTTTKYMLTARLLLIAMASATISQPTPSSSTTVQSFCRRQVERISLRWRGDYSNFELPSRRDIES